MKNNVCKVLVAENNPTILKILALHLEAEGCRVKTVSNGLEALLQLDNEIPDILFTDIIMPKVSGDQLCAIIRKDKRLCDIFIAVHSSTSLEDNHSILDLDADAYIAKGPAVNLKRHVSYVLEQYRKGERRNQQTMGATTLHPREITRELLLARKHYQAIFNNVAEAVVELDETGQIVQANVAAQKLFRKGILKILSANFIDFLTGQDKQDVLDWLESIKKNGTNGSSNFKSSYSTPLQVKKRKILLNLVAIEEGESFFFIGILQDITLQKNTELMLAKTLNDFNAVIDTIDYGVLLLDKDLQTCIVNQAYRNLWQLSKEFTDQQPTLKELMQKNSSTGLYGMTEEDLPAYIEERVANVRKGGIAPMELQRADGKYLRYQCVVLPDDGRLLTYYDITSLKHTEKKLEEALETVSNLANHDPLTGLPNLRLAREKLLSALSLSRRKGWMAAIMFIDLDGFKDVNDLHGHEIGDKVLTQVAERLVDKLRQVDTVARIGGDEFLVIQTEVHHRFAAANVAEKIVKSISRPFVIGDLEITIGASIGIAIYPENGEDSRVLMKKADDAMYYTKRIGKNNYTFTPA
jgi:diguanylate cyclase (GGDEF)-like protein/PAS domain S-box-containing protein